MILKRFNIQRKKEKGKLTTKWTIWLFLIIWVVSSPLNAQNPQEMNLSQAVDVALGNNPAIGAAQWQRQAAEHQVWEARSGYFPQIMASAGYTRYQEPNIITPIHEPMKFPPLDDEIYESSLQLKMPLFDGFRTRAKVRAASAAAEEATVEAKQARINLIQNVTDIFIRWEELADNQRLLTAHLKALKRRHHELSVLKAEGRISAANLSLVESAIDAARSDSLDLENKRLQLADRLGQLLGADRRIFPQSTEIHAGWSAEMAAMTVHPDSLLAPSGQPGPTVQKARAQLERAEAFKSSANRSFFPDLSGFAVYNWRAGADRDPISEWAAGITLSFPLFQGGKRIASVKAGAASLHAAKQGYQAARQQERTQLQIAYQQWQSARNRQQFLKGAIQNKQKSVEAQRDLYKEGRLSLSELLTQENELLDLKIQERSLLYQEISALLSYHATAGTLTKEKIQMMIKE